MAAGITKRTQGERIRYARKDAGLSQTELARAIAHLTGRKISGALISQWENDITKNPELNGMLALEAITGFRLEWIVAGKPPEKHGADYESGLDATPRVDARRLERALVATLKAVGHKPDPATVAACAAALYDVLTDTPELGDAAVTRMAAMLTAARS